MSYATELTKDFVDQRTFVKVFPVLEISANTGDWTLSSGVIYKYLVPSEYRVSRFFGQTNSNSEEPEYYTEVFTSAVTGSEWFYDDNDGYIYFRKNNITSFKLYVELELLFATEDIAWNRIPDTSSSAVNDWIGTVKKAPEKNITLSDSLFGFTPSQSSQFILSNPDQFMEEIIDSYSFKDCKVEIWKQFGDLQNDNFSLFFIGYVSNYDYSVNEIVFSVNDENKLFENTISNGIVSSGFATSNEVDPGFINTYRRVVVCGVHEGVKLINVSYNDQSNTNTDNELYVVPFDQLYYSFEDQVDPVGAHTTSRIYLLGDFADSYIVGDKIQIKSGGGVFTPSSSFQRTITAKGSNYIDFSPVLGAPYSTVGHVSVRPYVDFIYIEQDNARYTGHPFRDFDSDSDGRISFVFGYDLTGSYTNMGMPNPIEHSSTVYIKKLHNQIRPTFEGNPVCAVDIYNGLSNGVGAIYHILKEFLSIPETEIDGDTFVSMASTYLEECAIFAPLTNGAGEELIRDVIGKLLLSTRMRLFKDANNLWTIRRIKPFTTPTYTITDDEIIKDSFIIEYSYDDIITRASVRYKYQDRSTGAFLTNEFYPTVSFENLVAKTKHRFKKERTFDTYLSKKEDAEDLSEFLAYYFSDRRAIAKVKLPREYFGIEIGDEIRISRARMPGFEYDAETLRNKDFVVIGTLKDRDSITLTLDDQKGLEDNS